MARTFFYGETVSPGGTVTGDAVTAKTSWLANVENPAAYGFEDMSDGLRASGFTFNSPAPQAQVVTVSDQFTGGGTGQLRIQSGSIVNGRFNTTSGGGKWLDCRDTCYLAFATPVEALGFYATDFGDFLGQVTATLYEVGGGTQVVEIPHSNPADNANLAFWGFVGDVAVERVELNCVYDDPQPDPEDFDFFGLDDITIAEQPVPPPVFNLGVTRGWGANYNVVTVRMLEEA